MLEVEKKSYVKPVGSNAFRTVLIFLQWPLKKKQKQTKSGSNSLLQCLCLSTVYANMPQAELSLNWQTRSTDSSNLRDQQNNNNNKPPKLPVFLLMRIVRIHQSAWVKKMDPARVGRLMIL